MHYDVIIIGGSYAAMAAALQLVRARRTVLVIDAGERRNRFSHHSHGFLSQDGMPPGEIAARAREQLQAYPTLTWLEQKVQQVTGQLDDFCATTTSGESFQGRRILLAIGVLDQLPAIDGLAQRWGKSIFLCPYCHGYELNQGHIGIIGTGPLSTFQAEMLTDWGRVTLLVNNALELDNETKTVLASRDVAIETVPISAIEGHADVVLTDQRRLSFAGLFTATRTTPASNLAQAMGCEMEEALTGIQIRTDTESKTSIVGVFACGDVARSPHSISLAVGNGAMTGAQIHRSLLWPASVLSTPATTHSR